MSKGFKIPFSNQSLDQNTIRILYVRNKMYVFPGIFFTIAVLLFFFAVLPQIQSYFILLEEVKSSESRVAVLKSNVAVLSGINIPDLDKKLQAVVTALPSEKDFAGILRVIGVSATESNVKLGDFSFEVGNVSSEATKVANALPIEINVIITSDLVGTKSFLESLTRRFPLSEVTSMQISEKSSNIKIIFYYKPLPNFTLTGDQKLKPLSKEESGLFDRLSSFTSVLN